MFKTLEKIKNWVVGIFAIIGGIAVVWALKKDSRSEKEFKSDLKKIGTKKKQVEKNVASKQKKVNKLKEELKKNESILADLEKQRSDELRNLANLTEISDTKQLVKAQEINEEFDVLSLGFTVFEDTNNYTDLLIDPNNGNLYFAPFDDPENLIELIYQHQNLSKYLEKKEIKKKIFIPNKLINIIV